MKGFSGSFWKAGGFFERACDKLQLFTEIDVIYTKIKIPARLRQIFVIFADWQFEDKEIMR